MTGATGRAVRVRRARIHGAWHADAVVRLGQDGLELVPPGSASPGDLPLVEVALLPPVTDHHVHLGLSDAAEAAPSALARVVDLGWAPDALPGIVDAALAAHPALDVRSAGPFHTAPGGYPSDRAWAPAGAVVELPDERAAIDAVAALARGGASLVKAVCSSDAGPALGRRVLDALIAEAHERGLRVVVHAQGAAQAALAIAGGADALAHTPWTEPLPAEVIADAAERTAWVSTLAMHERDGDEPALERATSNLAAFAAAGGTVLYGTDLGNGLTRLDVDPRELAALERADLDATAILDALVHPGLVPPGDTLSALPPDVDDDEAALAAIGAARPVRLADLEASA